MFFDVIQSGSKGNATLVFENETIILIDMGIAIYQLEDELKKYNKSINDIDAVLITHNHSDHIKSIKCFSPKIIYSPEGNVPGGLSNSLEFFKPVTIKDITFSPIKTSHDAINPCGYILSSSTEKLVYMTDTGVYIKENNEYVKNPDYLIIESNHDISMELHTKRTMKLKERVLSSHGHLCNEDSAFAALEIIGDKTKEIVLAHLSEEANTPEVALAAYKSIFDYAHVDINKYKVRCAGQRESLIGGNYEN